MPRKAIAAILALILTTGFSANQRTDSNCLARTIYHEARGVSRLDQEAVAHVVINRTESPQFPRSICGVVYARGAFTWANKNPPINERAAWQRSQALAEEILEARSNDPTKGATYFWSPRVNPRWTRNLTVTLQTPAHKYGKAS